MCLLCMLWAKLFFTNSKWNVYIISSCTVSFFPKGFSSFFCNSDVLQIATFPLVFAWLSQVLPLSYCNNFPGLLSSHASSVYSWDFLIPTCRFSPTQGCEINQSILFLDKRTWPRIYSILLFIFVPEFWQPGSVLLESWLPASAQVLASEKLDLQ